MIAPSAPLFTLPPWLLQPEPVVALALASALLAGLVVALVLRRAHGAQERGWLRELAEAETALAVERQRGLRIPELEGALDQREALIATLRGEAVAAGQAIATLRETLAQERRQAGEKLALLAEARTGMTDAFRTLADEVLRTHGREFGEQNREQIGTLLNPVRERLAEYQQGLQAAALEAARERATLAEQVRALAEAGAAMTGETRALVTALRGQTQRQGAWGEMVLATVLRLSGLREGAEYTAQATILGEDGQRLRPDVVVRLPQGPSVVIDSKVSLRAFERHVNAAPEAEGEAAAHLADHVASLRAHIRGLGGKEYGAAVEGALDTVIMFVPIEGALSAAMGADPELAALAAERRVALATPTTLMIALRTVANVWQADRRQRNAEEIARRAGLLHDKFISLLDDLTAAAKGLDVARGAYDAAFARLATGRGNLVWQADELRRLGASARKAVPPSLLDDTEAAPVDEP